MHRPALARLYRPKRFSEIVGQDHVSTTLRAAVQRGRVGHAYLFCGPRGVGKTTAARVLAMALNCEERADGEPCGTCQSCQRIWSGRTSLDVVEIDAASNRGVDDARDLRERAMYAPSEESRYKVYIIDEAHMLTREAWNATLKILEEPPSRVIFVLATTEPGKIFQTAPPILSRCQRFDFHRIPMDRILERLKQVLEAEGVQVDDSALLPVARKADGALRDALSALDQVLAFSGERVAVDDVRQVLGLVEEDLFFELFQIIADGRPADVFEYVERLMERGYDLEEFYRGLGEALRLLLKARLAGSKSLRFVPDELVERYEEFAQLFEVGDLLRMLSTLAELDTDGRFRKNEQQRLLIEVVLLKFAMLDRTVDLEELIDAARGNVPDNPGHGPGNPGTERSAAEPPRASAERERRATESNAAEPADGQAHEGAGASEPAPEPGSGDRSGDLSAVREAWMGMISDGDVLRPGQGIALRTVQLTGLGSEGELRVQVPAGTPGAQVLEDTVTRRRIEEELARRLGHSVNVVMAIDEEGVPPRVSEDSVRDDQLERLVSDDQKLRRIVDKLDLELLD